MQTNAKTFKNHAKAFLKHTKAYKKHVHCRGRPSENLTKHSGFGTSQRLRLRELTLVGVLQTGAKNTKNNYKTNEKLGAD